MTDDELMLLKKDCEKAVRRLEYKSYALAWELEEARKLQQRISFYWMELKNKEYDVDDPEQADCRHRIARILQE